MSANDENKHNIIACVQCKNSQQLGVELRNTKTRSSDIQCDEDLIQAKCQSWLEKCTISSDGESVYSSESGGTNDSNISEYDQQAERNGFHKEVACFSGSTEIVGNNADIVRKIFNQQQNVYGNVHIQKSKEVRLGNVTNIYGPVYITQQLSMVNQQSITNQVFLELPAPVQYGELTMVSRKSWQALCPVQERTLLNGPAKFVIFSHTVSEPVDNTQLENTRLIQSVQRFHMIKLNFDDIGYNFLIGTDGNVYEGRGWSVAGEHAHKYNRFSVGISFVGYFTEKLPSEESIKQAQILIKRGVEMGAIEENYTLLGHCQCSETESPGDMLYLEMQKWDKWDKKIDVRHPSPLVSTPVVT